MQPLADRLRPKTLEELEGQVQLTSSNGLLSKLNSTDFMPSMIFWGPTGSGKTTVAKILLNKEGHFSQIISATNTGIPELRKIFELAESRYRDFNKSTILFIDEIHSFKKNQQDVLLPYIENGVIILIGATTENPSFELNNAILSRCRVVIFKPLETENLDNILKRAETFLQKPLPLDEEARKMLIAMSNGDARYMLNMAEELFKIDTKEPITAKNLTTILDKRKSFYDKSGDNHYSLISAFHKSIRGSDVQASLYWMARMIEGGEEYHYIFRRLMNIAVEDIGMADPQAIVQVVSCLKAFDTMGKPDGTLCLTQAVIYCATAPKSNAGYVAQSEVFSDVKTNNYQSPPKHIINGDTKMMREMGYGAGYIYDHDTKNCFSGQNYFPADMNRREYYKPNERGFEREIKKRLEYWEKLRKEINKQK